MKVFLTGGTGFIGRFLVRNLLKESSQIYIATRQNFTDTHSIKYIDWFALSDEEKTSLISECDVIINLAGENIAARRWSHNQQAKIIRSRTEITSSIVEVLNKLPQSSDRVFVSASAVGYYGDCRDEIITENTPPGDGFLAEVCKIWESEALEARTCRTVIARIGVVLHSSGGALKKMMQPYYFFIGGPLGSGKQYVPWVHIKDLMQMFLFVIKNPDCKGAYNFVSPNPCTMRELSKALGKALRRPHYIRTPEFILKIMLGKAASMLTISQRVVPQRLLDAGFNFKFPTIEEAFKDLLIKKAK